MEGKPTVLQKFAKQCQVCLRMFYNESKYEEDQEEHSKLIDLSGSMHCPSCYVKVAKLEINQHYLDDHPELKSACCLHCEGIIKCYYFEIVFYIPKGYSESPKGHFLSPFSNLVFRHCVQEETIYPHETSSFKICKLMPHLWYSYT